MATTAISNSNINSSEEIDSLNNITTQEKECLREIRGMIEASPNALLQKNSWPFSDDFLLRYIRSRSYNVASAFDRLQNHMYVRRKKNPEIFARLFPSAVYDAIQTAGARVLKHRDDKGRGVLLCSVGSWDPDLIPVDDYLLALMLLGWEMLGTKETQLNGIVIVIDGRGFAVKHAKQGTPGNVQKYADLIVRSSPFKCKGAHIVYAPCYFNMTLSLIKMFLPHKLRKRIHVHGSSVESLHEFIPKEVLPESLGGELGEEEAVDGELIRGLCDPGGTREGYYRGFVG